MQTEYRVSQVRYTGGIIGRVRQGFARTHLVFDGLNSGIRDLNALALRTTFVNMPDYHLGPGRFNDRTSTLLGL